MFIFFDFKIFTVSDTVSSLMTEYFEFCTSVNAMRNTFSTVKSTIRKVLSFSQLIKNTALSYLISTVLPESLFAA